MRRSESSIRKLRVLLYHSLSTNGRRDALTVSEDQLDRQFRYLREKGYSAISLSELIAYCDGGSALPANPVLITFDDGFRNNAEIAYPLAKKYGQKINLFVVPFFIRKGSYGQEPCLQPDDLQNLDTDVVEIGLHSFSHSNYADLLPGEIAADIECCLYTMDQMGIPYQPCFAYPYGGYPRRSGSAQQGLFRILEQKGIRLAFRIGNRINPLPFRDRFLIQRLDIRGDESFFRFKMKLAFGKRLSAIAALMR